MHRPALILAAIAAVFPAIASAGDGGDPWILQFQLENDLFNDTDRDYTNGWMLSIITPDVYGPDAPDWLRSAGQNAAADAEDAGARQALLSAYETAVQGQSQLGRVRFVGR